MMCATEAAVSESIEALKLKSLVAATTGEQFADNYESRADASELTGLREAHVAFAQAIRGAQGDVARRALGWDGARFSRFKDGKPEALTLDDVMRLIAAAGLKLVPQDGIETVCLSRADYNELISYAEEGLNAKRMRFERIKQAS